MNERLKEIRKSMHMTQEIFAKSIGISRSNLTNIELGKIQLTDRLIKTICSVHNINENWLRYGNENMHNELTSDDELSLLIGSLYADNDEFKKKVIKTMLNMNDNEWMFIKNFIEKNKS